MGLIKYNSARTVKPYGILEAKNALVKSVGYVKHGVIHSLVKPLARHCSMFRNEGIHKTHANDFFIYSSFNYALRI
jgi:hypothetical protein